VGPYKPAAWSIPIFDLPEAAGKGLKSPVRQSTDCRSLLGSTGRLAGAGLATLRGV